MSGRRSSSLAQELNRQLFGVSRRPLRHASQKLVRTSVNLTHAIIRDILGSVVGVGRARHRRRRR